jgi:hypothetical protein
LGLVRSDIGGNVRVEHPEIRTSEHRLEALEHFMRSLELPRAVTTATREFPQVIGP